MPSKSQPRKTRTDRACICSGPDDCADAMKVLSDPTRLRIVRELIGGARNVSQLAKAVALDQPRVSHHLARMRMAGLVVRERQGRKLIYRIHPNIGVADMLNFGCCQISFRGE
jgi:DNA-binding transcriptional ArsR family regulator